MTRDRIIDTDIRRPEISIGHRVAFALAAFSVGALLAVYIFPLDFLLDRWAWWDRVAGDNATGLVGYHYFAQDEWRWPLLQTRLLDPPDGVNIIYTDPVPIAAILGKIAFKLTGALQIYMGHWMLLSYGLQSLISSLIFRRIGLRPISAIVAAALISLTPSFIYRFPHIGLVAHFLILAAILFYLRMVTIASKREMAMSAIGVGAILFVNPYLLAMSATIFIAGIMETLWRKRISWREAVGLVALVGTVAGALAFVFGIVGQGGLPSVGGFGLYSMNLLSPVVPQLSAVPGHESYQLDKTGGQYEGFNYLGAGALFLLFCALAFRLRTVREMAARHRFLVIAIIGLVLFAASSTIYVGSWQVVNVGYENLPLLRLVTSVFRCSGRFFWPVGYVIVIGAITVLVKSTSRQSALLLIAAAVTLQLVDMRPMLNYARAANLPYADHLNRALWGRAVARHSEVTIYPDYYCIERSHHGLVTQLQLLAARAQIPVNAAYVNRKQPDCSDQRHWTRLDAASVTQDPLVVVFKDGFPAEILETDAAAGFFCRDASFAFVCSRQGNNPAFVALGGGI